MSNSNLHLDVPDTPALRIDFCEGSAPFVMAIDVGSSSVRTAIYDCLGRTIEKFSTQIEYEATTDYTGESVYDADEILQSANSCIDRTLNSMNEAGGTVAAVGFSCFWHSLMGIDSRGQAATPVLHLTDTRSSNQADALRAELDQTYWRSQTGTVFHSSYWPSKLKWLVEDGPYSLDDVETLFSVGDYLYAAWTGETLTSLSMASGTGLCKLSSGKWCEDLIQAVGADRNAFPEIVDRDHFGTLCAEYRKRWSNLADAKWTPALGDGACANIGSGAVDPKSVAMTLGTTGAVRVARKAPIGSDCQLYDDLWAYRLDATTVLHGAAITNGGLWFDWTRDHFSANNEDIVADAAKLTPAQHGLTVLPFLAGERSPIWNDYARAAIVGLSPSTTKLDIARASIESIALRLRLIYEDVAVAADNPHRIVANGAALLRSREILQMVTDAVGHDIQELPTELEASARGAAVLALDTVGANQLKTLNPAENAPTVSPDTANTAIYQKELERQEQLSNLLFANYRTWEREEDIHP